MSFNDSKFIESKNATISAPSNRSMGGFPNQPRRPGPGRWIIFNDPSHHQRIKEQPDGRQVLPLRRPALEGLRPSTRRVYVAGAKAAIRAACLELWQSPSTDELLALIRESPTEKRISPFLAFLGDVDPKNSLSDEDIAGLQNWVIQTLSRRGRLARGEIKYA